MALLLLTTSTLAASPAPSTLAASPAPTLWPAPKSAKSGASTIYITPSQQFFDTSSPSLVLRAAFDRYNALTFPHTTGTEGLLTRLQVTVDDSDDSHPQLGTNESYHLEITTRPSATLTAKTVYGALRGLETFSQLVTFDFETETYVIDACPWTITDEPRFAHRGLMVDTARHFQPLASLKAIVDSLPYAKINVLHWHLVDTQSFPFHSKSNPKLWDGSYDKHSRYTHSDVSEIVE